MKTVKRGEDRVHVGSVLLRAVTAAGGWRRGAGGLRKRQEGRESKRGWELL